MLLLSLLTATCLASVAANVLLTMACHRSERRAGGHATLAEWRADGILSKGNKR